MVLMASAGSMTIGAVRWSKNGQSDNALMFLLFGAIVAVFVIFGVALTVISDSLNRESANLPYSDSPPKYRETWRRQHLESCSLAVDNASGASIEPASLVPSRRSTHTNISRLDVRSLWSSSGIPGVHQSARRVSMINERTGRELEIFNRPNRANTAPPGDEGLPSYEEAMGK